MKYSRVRLFLAIIAMLLLSGMVYSQDSTCAQGDFQCKVDAATRRISANTNDIEAYYERAQASYRLGDADGAISDYSKYISLKPSKADYLSDGYAGRADSYRKKGSMAMAMADYNRAIATAPMNVSGYIGRGNAYVEQKNYAAALTDFNKAVSIAPDNAETYYGRARVYQRQMNWNAAILDFDKYISMKTGNDAYLSDGYYARGSCYFSKANYTQAVNDYTKAIELHPTAAMYKDRAAAYRKLGKTALANADDQEAAEIGNQ